MRFLTPIALAAACLVALPGFAGVALEGSGGGVGKMTKTTAERMAVDRGGIGHVQLIPYYSANGGNQTLLAITNEDAVNGKLIKVRFRSAANADTVYDFMIFLGPVDVWSANIAQGPDGRARLLTSDNSCSIPQNLTSSFKDGELPSVDVQFSGEMQRAWTREGFIEIINVADAPPTSNSTANPGGENPLYRAMKTVNGAATCSQPLFDSNVDVVDEADAVNKGLDTPSGGLSAWATIINTQDALVSWPVESTALVAVGPDGRPGRGRLVNSPQTADVVDGAKVSSLTSDPVLRLGTLPSRQYHFPDLSTPYLISARVSRPFDQAVETSTALAVTRFSNQYSTLGSIRSGTDLITTQPMQRYFVGVSYAGVSDVDRVLIPEANGFYRATDIVMVGKRACSKLLTVVDGQPRSFAFDRSGRGLDTGGGAVITGPGPVTYRLCGGSNNYAINSGDGWSVLKGAREFLTYPWTTYQEGWIRFSTPGAGLGLPLIGASFVSAVGPEVGGKSTNFGWSMKHNLVVQRP